MECCDSVPIDGASGPHTQQPPGLCRTLAPSPFLLAKDQAIHPSTATLSEQGELVGRIEEEGLGERYEEIMGENQLDECSTREMIEDEGLRENDEEVKEDDVKPLGKILYQNDGSAYVTETESQRPCGIPSSSLGAPASIISTCYISSSQSPAPHVFHVFHMPHLDDSERLALMTRQSKDNAPDVAGSSEAEVTRSNVTKPVLMCFPCRLSFSRSHLFRAHALQQHNITFSDEEQHLLSFKHTSAILQHARPGNPPLLCFLEPKRNCESVVPLHLAPPTSGNNAEDTARRKENEEAETSKPRLPLLPSPPRTSPATSVPSPAKDPSTLGREAKQRGKEDEIRKDGGSSVGGERRMCLEVESTVENSAHSISSSSRQEHNTDAALSNQSISEPPNSATIATSFMNNTKTLTDSETECGTSFNCHDPAPASLVVVNPPTVNTTEQLADQESATATKPNDQLENGNAIAMEPTTRLSEDDRLPITDLPNNPSHSTSPTLSPTHIQSSQPVLEEGHLDSASRGRLVVAGDGGFVALGDDVQGSYAYSVQASMAHTRNSCKTLKCPKCNWHYKYQQTLEAHMKEKHPETDSGQCQYCNSGQSHPRLARGETYSCGYKPFRCQVCQYSTTTKGNLSIHMQSDKHLNNMQSLQTQSHAHTPVAQPSPLSHSHPPIAHPTQANSPSPSKLRGRASWRCEVCDYETNVARNLRIHMTSEKHTHNVLLLQQNLAHMQRQRKHNATELYRHCQPQTKLPDSNPLLSSNDTLTDSALKLFECILCGCFSCDTLEELSQHLTTQRSLPNAYWRSTTGDTHHCRLCHYATPLRANFQLHCQTDKHIQRYQLAAHLREASSHHGNLEEEDEWRLRCVAAGNQAQLRCNACDYEASSLEKLKLHTMNSRHEASIRLYKYLQKLDGAEAEGVWLHCALCDFSTRNSISLVQHSHSPSHQRGEGLLRIQRIQNGLQDEEELGAIFTIQKSPAQENGEHKGMDSPTEVTPNKEDRPGKKSEGFIQTEVEKSESPLASKRPSSGSGESDEPSSCKRPRVQEEMRQCPFCRFRHTDLERLRSHVMNQHAVQPALRCPLCQDTLHSVALLRTHLTHLHSVTADCTQKLISTVIASDVLPEKMFLPVQNSDTQQTMNSLNMNETKRLDEISTDAEPERGSTPQETSKIHKQPSEDAESTKENSAAFPCWQKGCNKVFTSSSALQTHFNQLHSQKSPTAISDRHVYKYRCNQCSLAFKTPEKLQQHSQYHAIRAATMCCLCQRSFRTMQALRKHLETNHTELSETQIQQLYGGLMMNGESLASKDQVFCDEEESSDETAMKDDEECEMEEKLSPTDHDSGLIKENSECDIKQTVIPLRKGPNITMEKFLDPSRPFKCTVCKESFTQKNILLVHYNSVSHLHKLKRSLQDTSTGMQEPVNSTDHKPFKCSICNVAYSQSSTLEIHMRSVLHQTKARASKLDSSNSESVSTLPGKTVSSTPATLKPLTNNAGLNHKQNTEHNGANADTSQPLTSEVRNKLVDIIDSATKQQQMSLQQPLQQQQLAQAQAHLQQELQKKAALLQSHLFNPALLHSFPMAAEALLPVQQQQQLLLPFLIPGGDFYINPELSLNISTLKPTVNEDTAGSSKKNDKTPLKDLAEKSDIRPKMNEQKLSSDSQCENGTIGQNKEESKEVDGLNSNETTELKESEDLTEKMPGNAEVVNGFLPPRIAHDAPGTASRALLENIGFELVMQFNENKQRYQKNLTEVLPNSVGEICDANKVDNSDNTKKLECESCGKLFSNVLILKSHKEQIHGSIFPIKSLEKFAKDYREKYDKLFPFRLTTPEASPVSSPSPSPPAPPPTSVQQPQQPLVQPIIPASTLNATPATVSISQIKAPLAPIPLPMELPLFPPLLMPPLSLQALTSQVPVHLPPVEAGLTPDLTQLYQQQLTPAMLQQQNKRPRTRITDDQLQVLRQYFDINNSPNEDQIHEMANKSGLPQKVIKHWFRNTLFKERQRNKDSPYNFSNPPITTLEDLNMDSKPPSPDPPRQDCYGGRRSSRTRFTDYQIRVLQDFFDANAYPKDDEFEQLSNLLNLSTRVIVVWFQNARQKARKNYENQGEGGKESERRDLSNDRYFRNSNSSYQCKKCSMVFQRIIDLINHQKKHCYKDEDEEMLDDQNETMMDSKIECHSPISGPSCLTPEATSSSPSSSSVFNTNVKSTDSQTKNPTGELKQTSEASSDLKQATSGEIENSAQKPESNCEQKQNASSEIHTPSPPKQEMLSCTSQTNSVPSQSSQKMFSPLEISSSEQQQHKPPQEISPYHCIQCKLSFPSFEHWQEHQQMHFLTQSYFPTPQFLDRPVDMPLMLFDPTNPLLARHLLSGTIPQMAANPPAMTTIPDSTINSLKRKLEEKAGSSSMEHDWENNGDEPHRDKRMRTTITPEQLEVLYQKYLLDSNPTRKMLDHISNEVGLKKRVVQVWFQNTRARERKGQFRALGPTQIHRRCPFCRALFKAQTALAAHIRSRHWHEARNAGYSLAMSSMIPDQESSHIKTDLFDFSHYSQFSNTLDNPDSPTSKSIDLSSHQRRLSPKSLKSEGIEDFENPSMSVYQTFEQSKLNNCEPTTNMTHDHSIYEGNDSLDGKHGSVDQMSPNTEREASSENDEKMSSGLVSPAISFNAKDFDNDLVLDYSENSSLADPASPCPGSSSSQGFDERQGQKRYRTQMTNLQVKVLKACFSDYKTPTMLECEALGNDIGLGKRVVQVWFQNARAKEKKAKLSLAKQFGTESTSIDRPKTECTLCSVKYSGRLSVRDHVFSQQHLAKVKEALGGQMERDKEYLCSVSVRQMMPHQEVDQLKKTSDVLGLNQTALQSQSSVSSTSTSIPGGSNTMAASFSTIKTGASESPVNEGTRKPASTSSSAISAMDDKDVVSTTNSVLTPKTTQQELQLQFPKENNTESKKMNKLNTTPQSNSSCSKEKPDSSRPELSTPNTAREYAIDPSQLQALHAAMKSEQAALLPSPLLPYMMPGFPPIFPSHIPTPMSSGLLQPMFGIDSMFPYSPVLPQALMGLSPGSLLQQYQQNLQGALMQQRLQLQQKQLQQTEKPKPSQISARLHAEDTRGPDSSKHDKKQSTPNGTHSPTVNPAKTKQTQLDDSVLQSHCIVSKAYGGEVKDDKPYDCLACGVSFTGNAGLIKHLENPQHRQRVAERLNSKEHASPELPHVSPSSTSQPDPPGEQRSSSTAQSSLETPSASSDQSDTQRPQSSSSISALPETTQSSSASLTHHILSPSSVTSSLTSLAKTCHVKPADSADGCCDESDEGQDST